MVKNTNWPEANQSGSYKRGRGFKFGATKKRIQVVDRAGLKPRTAGLRVRLANNSATLRKGPFSRVLYFQPLTIAYISQTILLSPGMTGSLKVQLPH